MDEERRDEEIEVEGHVTGHGESDEPAEGGEDDVEAHVQRFSNVRMDSPSNT
ncbi:MAG TPA: hypothetical protein VKB43_04040 [Gaiellaceae bacterium]|nr:hypothetical protein [Gaiellaceae bacterium]